MVDKNEPSHSDSCRMLIRGVNWLGDAVMSTPALQRLRERFPNAHIALLIQEKLAGLWEHQPSINTVIPFSPGDSIFSISRRLRHEKCDTALVLPNSPRSAFEVWLAGIPRRVGHSRLWRNCFLTQVVPGRPGHISMKKRPAREVKELIAACGKITPSQPIPTSAHQIHDFLHLAAALGSNPLPLKPFLHVTDAEMAGTAKRFQLAPDKASRTYPLFGLNAGAEYGPAKRWPRERFVAAAVEVQKRIKCRWVVCGGKGDLELAADIASSLETLHGKLI